MDQGNADIESGQDTPVKTFPGLSYSGGVHGCLRTHCQHPKDVYMSETRVGTPCQDGHLCFSNLGSTVTPVTIPVKWGVDNTNNVDDMES